MHVAPNLQIGYIQVWMLSAAGKSPRKLFDFMRRHV